MSSIASLSIRASNLLPDVVRTLQRGIAGAAVCAAALLQVSTPAHAEDGRQDFSAAERLLFMSSQLANVRAPTTLRYSFRQSGALEPGFDDTVEVAVALLADGTCCTGKSSFLSGARALPMPDLDGIQGNPVTMYFLERDVREMNRLTKGAQNYFRKRIRMAIYNGAAVRDIQLVYRGKPVAAKEVTFSPYLDDPNRARYEKLAGKHYQFLLSDAVPGGVYGIRTRINGDTVAGSPALLVEEMWLDGADRQVDAARP